MAYARPSDIMINKTDKSFTLIIIRFAVRETGITDKKVMIKL